MDIIGPEHLGLQFIINADALSSMPGGKFPVSVIALSPTFNYYDAQDVT